MHVFFLIKHHVCLHSMNLHFVLDHTVEEGNISPNSFLSTSSQDGNLDGGSDKMVGAKIFFL